MKRKLVKHKSIVKHYDNLKRWRWYGKPVRFVRMDNLSNFVSDAIWMQKRINRIIENHEKNALSIRDMIELHRYFFYIEPFM